MPDTSLNLKNECSITCNNPVVTDKKNLLNNVHQESEPSSSDTNMLNRSAATKMNSGTKTPITIETKPKIYRYTVSTLIEISKLPISKKRPDYLDNPIFVTKGFVKSSDIQYDDRMSINRNPNLSENNGKRRQVVQGGGMNINSNNLTNESRDRIRKEHDNALMLSPQRRSFNMGCHLPPNNNNNVGGGPGGGSGGVSTSMNRIDRNDTNIRGRIGSGRIVNRDVSWDYKVEKDNQEEFIFRPGGGLMGLRDRERDNNTKEQRNDYYRDDNKYDRRSYNNNNNMRDDGKDSMNQNSRINHRNNRYSNQNMNHNSHYNNHRNNRYMDNREDEPEWFSGGPTSQNDTIELRGFDDVKDETNHSQKFDNNNVNNNNDGVDATENNKSHGNSVSQHSNYTGTDSKKNSNNDHQNFSSTNDKQKTNHDFNFEDFLKLDTIPGLLPNNDLSSKDNRSSRFSQWFHSDSPNSRIPESPHSSQHGDLNNMVEDFLTEQFSHGGQLNDTFGGKPSGHLMNTTTGLGISNNESNKYFAPISPENPTINLLEILQRNENVHSNPSDCSIIQQSTNKIQSVEELEARMLQSGGGGPIHKQQQKISINNQSSTVQQNEMNAFKKLLSQISKNPQNIGMQPMQQQNLEQHSLIQGSSDGLFNNDSLISNNDNSEGTSLLQLLNKQKDIKRINHTPMFNNFSNMNINQQQSQHNMLSRSNPQLSQQQQQHQMQKFQMSQLNQIVNQNNSDMFSKMLHLDQLPMNNNNQRSDPQITVDGMHWNENQYQALLNSSSNRNREFMLNNNQLDGSNISNQTNNALSSAIMQLNQVGKMAQHQNDIGQQQNPLIYPAASHIQNQKSLRSSPLPNNTSAGMSQRIPSPRELQFHTQSIMQQALIRKKLEEQREKFRRQEIQEQTTNIIPSQQQQGVASSPNKHNIHIQSPTQIAFTPTSVLRKMTADKDDNNISSLSSIMGTDMNSQNGSLINGGIVGTSNNKIRENTTVDKAMNAANNLNFLKHLQQAQSSQNTHGLLQSSLNQNHGISQQQSNSLYNNPQIQMKWNSQMQQQQQSIKPVGRPILKGGTQMQYAASLEYQQQQSLIQQSQQQQQSSQRNQRKKSSNSNVILGMSGGGSGSSGGGGSGGLVGSASHQKSIPNQINQQQSANTSAQLHQILHHRQQMQQQQQQQRALRAPQFNYNQQTSGNSTGAECLINYNREGCLSPTSNQLARWFSPELLAQAQAGKLPSLNIGQALSLEEFEKRIQHSSSKVHN